MERSFGCCMGIFFMDKSYNSDLIFLNFCRELSY